MRKLLFFLLIPLLGISQTIQLEQARRIAVLAGAGGGGVTTEYQAVLDEATTQGYTLPSAGDQTIQNQIIVDLKSAGAWSRIDCMYYLKGSGDSDFKLLDWKNPTTRSATVIPNGGSLTWASTGVTGDGNAYIETNFAPDVDGVNWTLNDAGMIIGVATAADDYIGTLGVNTNFIESGGRPATGPNLSTSPLPPVVDFTGTGTFSTHLYSGTTLQIFDGATSLSTVSRTPNQLYGELAFLRKNITESTGEISFVVLGGSFHDIMSQVNTALNQ